MTLSGLSGSPSRYCLHLPAKGRGLCFTQVSSFLNNRKSRKPTLLERSIQRSSVRKAPMLTHVLNASFGDGTNDSAIYPRMNIGDPYKRLGISREASEEEIQAARNFLIQRYRGHKPSVDAIESAHDKVIMQKLYQRKNPKIDMRKNVRAVTESPILQAVKSSFRTPSMNFIIKTCAVFAVLGALTVLFPTEDGPTVQVAISLMATVYFMYDRLKCKWRALLYGSGSFIVSWLLGTFLMVSVIPPLLKGPTSLEVTTALISYVMLWFSSTYLK